MTIYIALNEQMEACHHLGVFTSLEQAQDVYLANIIDVWSDIYDGSKGEFKSIEHYFKSEDVDGDIWILSSQHHSCFGNPYLEGCRCSS